MLFSGTVISPAEQGSEMNVFGGCVRCYALQTPTYETDIVVVHQGVGETPVERHFGWFRFDLAANAESFSLMDAVRYLYAGPTYRPI